jgi:hypothetical protein
MRPRSLAPLTCSVLCLQLDSPRSCSLPRGGCPCCFCCLTLGAIAVHCRRREARTFLSMPMPYLETAHKDQHQAPDSLSQTIHSRPMAGLASRLKPPSTPSRGTSATSFATPANLFSTPSSVQFSTPEPAYYPDTPSESSASAFDASEQGDSGKAENVVVAVRMRPLTTAELAAMQTSVWNLDEDEGSIALTKEHSERIRRTSEAFLYGESRRPEPGNERQGSRCIPTHKMDPLRVDWLWHPPSDGLGNLGSGCHGYRSARHRLVPVAGC